MARTAEDRAMQRAMTLARRGPRGINPQVGAVIVAPDGSVLSEGWHRGAGTAHAEVDALSKLGRDEARGATAIVTLEPCNHTGRTGPCAVALIDAGVARVVYAVTDPGERSGGGADRLRDAGIEVEQGLREDEGMDLIGDWLAVQRTGRPVVTVKWAQSLDGRAAAADGTSQWITGPESRADVHVRRAAADAIVAGIGTILADDPALTARRPDGTLAPHQPLAVALGRREIPPEAAVRRHPAGLVVDDGRDLVAMLAGLRERGVQRVFVEGGPTIASAFLRAGLVDEIVAYIAPVVIGGPRTAIDDAGVATIAEALRFEPLSTDRLGDDVRIVARPTAVHEPAPHAPHPTEGD